MSTRDDTIPCLVCGQHYRFLTTNHMRTHSAERPQTVPEYKDWLVGEFGIDKEMVPLAPIRWHERKHLFDGWEDR